VFEHVAANRAVERAVRKRVSGRLDVADPDRVQPAPRGRGGLLRQFPAANNLPERVC
jgi:hypothetical protein